MIQQAGVVARDNRAGDKYLAAYIVSRQKPGPTVNLIRQFMRDKVPDYMIPSTFTELESLPLVNGKLDRNALPLPERRRPSLSSDWVEPVTETEKRLEQIWRQILDIDGIGIHDNFFDLGGHSLAATRIVSQVIRTFHLELPLQSLFQSPTVAEMAAVIAEHQGERLDEKEMERILTELESLTDEEATQLLAEQSRTVHKRD
jgi:acyl carrier protein